MHPKILEIIEEVDSLDYRVHSNGLIQNATQVLETGQGDCLGGALAACLRLEQEGFLPYLLAMWDGEKGHAVAAFQHERQWHSIGHSRYPDLKHRQNEDFLMELAKSYEIGTFITGIYEAVANDLRESPHPWRRGELTQKFQEWIKFGETVIMRPVMKF